MLLNKHNLAVVDAVSTNVARIGLHHIHITGRYTEATNGHIAVRVSLPKVDTAGLGECELPSKGITIEADDIREIAKRLPKSKIIAIGEIKDDKVQIATDASVMFARQGDAPYPNTDQIWPSGTPKHKVSIDLKKLEKLVKIMRKAMDDPNRDAAQVVQFEFQTNPATAIVVRGFKPDDGQDVVGLIMPCRPAIDNTWSDIM